MGKMRWRVIQLLLAAMAAFAPMKAFGVVLHNGTQPADRPDDSLVGSWGGYASCVPIDANWVVLSRHQGGGFGTSVTLDGQSYTVVKKIEHSSADLALALLYKPTGLAAGLEEWAEVHTTACGPDYGCHFVLGGYGLKTGTPLETPSGVTYGYAWAGNKTTAEWGANTIDRVLFKIPGSVYFSSGLQADFDQATGLTVSLHC